MKIYIILLLLFIIAPNAFASSYQVHCSNAEATTKTSSGHIENSFSATERILVNGEVQDTKVDFQLDDLNLMFSESTVINQKIDNDCNQQGTGTSNSEIIIAKKLVVEASGEFLFSDNIVGVSADRKSIQTFVICQENYSGEFPCSRQ